MAQLLSTSNLLSQSRSLRSKYVYYQQLKDFPPDSVQRTAYEDIMREANTAFGREDTGALVRQLASTLRKQARAEAEKEVALLHESFGVDIPMDEMYSKEIGKEITLAYNYALSLKDVFERNVNKLIGNKEKGISKDVKTTITQVLPSYMITAINRNLDGIKKRVSGRISRGAEPEEAFEAEFQSVNMTRIVEEALDDALTSHITNYKSDDSDPFKELRAYLEKNPGQRDFIIEQMKINLGLEELKKSLIEEYKSGRKFANYRRGKKGGAPKMLTEVITKGTHKGIMAEALAQVVAEAAVDLQGKNFKTSFDTAWIGSKGGRPDFALTFGVNVDQILKAYSLEGDDSSREANRKRALDAAERLSRLKKGFVVYGNAKDWAQGSEFKGFTVVDGMTLKKYDTNTKRTKNRTLVGAIANTLEGAALQDDSYREDAIMALTSDIAVLAFDDVFTVGKENKGAKILHLFYLNGIYVPLSCMMWLLADAFEDSEKQDYRNLFKVSLEYKQKNILYPTGDPEGSYTWSGDSWAEQKERALNDIRIQAKLLKDFTGFVGEMIGRL